MGDKADVWQGTLALMVLKTLGKHWGRCMATGSPGASSRPAVTCSR